jgi:hypothetical protein
MMKHILVKDFAGNARAKTQCKKTKTTKLDGHLSMSDALEIEEDHCLNR